MEAMDHLSALVLQQSQLDLLDPFHLRERLFLSLS